MRIFCEIRLETRYRHRVEEDFLVRMPLKNLVKGGGYHYIYIKINDGLMPTSQPRQFIRGRKKLRKDGGNGSAAW